MNKLDKNLLFYSNFCLHSNNLINTISKTNLHNNILYICIDDKKIKIPSFISRVPSIYLIKEKTVLIEDNIDVWVSSNTSNNNKNNMPMQNNNMPMQNNNIPMQNNNIPMQNNNIPMQNNNMPMQNNNIQNGNNNMQNGNNNMQNGGNNDDNGEVLAFHKNEMGSNMSDNYSFLDEKTNINHNFTFLDGSNNDVKSDSRINTPKEFNTTNGQVKSQLDNDYDKLMSSRNSETFSKGIQRI